MLSKVVVSFKAAKFFRGQVLFKEGTPNDEVYIVKSGEFAANRTVIMENSNVKQSVVQYIRGQKTQTTLRSSFNPQFTALSKVSSIGNTSKTRESMQCFLFGLGQIFGEERLVREEEAAPYTV
jgi:CRP-like cAMP-binding protein